MKYRYFLFLLLGIDLFILLLKVPALSISYNEASLLYESHSFLQLYIDLSLHLFGKNDFALRIPMIILHLLSVVLLYSISSKYLKDEKNRLWLVLVFILLPGITSSALLVNSAGLVIFFLLLFLYFWEVRDTYTLNPQLIYGMLFVYLFIDASFMYLFLSLAFYALYTKDKKFFLFNMFLFFISIYLYHLDVYGFPKGHFLDAIGIYAAIFTPIIFIYLVYVLYRRYLTKNINIVWFIASIPLIVSLLLSFRQKVALEEFAPFVIVSLLLCAQTFSSSYRVRLKDFRKSYKAMFILSLVFLFLNSFLVFFNKNIYLVLENPKKHFAYKQHIAKELATKLKQNGIYCVDADKKMMLRLNFYNIGYCEENQLVKSALSSTQPLNVTISYKNIPVYSAYVTKLNNK